MDSTQRLQVWLTYKGFRVVRRASREFVRVERAKHGPIKLWLRLTASGWTAAGDRKSHRSKQLDDAIREFNDAERIVSGRDGDRLDSVSRRQIDAMADLQVQQMADFYASEGPLTLECIGKTRLFDYPGAKPFVMFQTLSALVMSMRHRAMILAEPARRDRNFAASA